MDLFGRERARLRKELEALQAQKDKTASRAKERQQKVHELERVIDDLKGEAARLKHTGAAGSDVTAAQRALDDAMSIHSESTR